MRHNGRDSVPAPSNHRVSDTSDVVKRVLSSPDCSTKRRPLIHGPAQQLFDTLDGDSDLRISFAEWMKAFDWIDSDSDGIITRKEFALSGGETSMFDAFDRRHKCALNRSEWQDAFRSVDTDHSQEISVQEWTRFAFCGASRVGLSGKLVERAAVERERRLRDSAAAKDKRYGANLGRALRSPGLRQKRVKLDDVPTFAPEDRETGVHPASGSKALASNGIRPGQHQGSTATFSNGIHAEPSTSSIPLGCSRPTLLSTRRGSHEQQECPKERFHSAYREMQAFIDAGRFGDASEVQRVCQRLADAGMDCARLCAELQERLASHGQTTVDEFGSTIAITCLCGNVFCKDSNFCRKCGRPRPEEEPAEVMRRQLRHLLRRSARTGDLHKAFEAIGMSSAQSSRKAPPRRKLRRTRTAFVGSYSQLVAFLRECHANCPAELPGAKLNTLLAALEDLSHGAQEDSMQSIMALEQGQEEAFSDIMGNLGIMSSSASRKMKRTTTRRSFASAVSRVLAERRCSVVNEEDFFRDFCDISWDSSKTMGVCKKRDVKALVTALERPFSLVSTYELDDEKLTAWMEAIADTYQTEKVSAYHNWRHACDVFQFSYVSLHIGGASKYFSLKDMLAILIASVGHDAGHPGTNNAFMVNSRSRLALIYNDASVLENMHASCCFELASRPECNFFEAFDKDEYDNVRLKVIEAILATDMSHHFEMIDRFSTRVAQREETPFLAKADRQPCVDRLDEDLTDTWKKPKASKADRRMLLRAMVHMADLGHCARPWSVHKRLVGSLETEFFSQGDKERELGLPVMPLMDRHKDSAAVSQDFFLGNLVLPLLDPFCTLLDEKLADSLLDNLSENRQTWQDLVKKYGRKTANEMIALMDG